jgi:hypothetical protein
MKRIIALVIAGLIATAGTAQETAMPQDQNLFATADMADLSEFRWKKSSRWNYCMTARSNWRNAT